MRVIRSRNVNGLFVEGLQHLGSVGESGDSRAGRVIVAPTPVMSIYERPMERVLLDAKRDANPFFHLMEGLWMLAGRDDAAFLDHYVKDFGSRFAENGVIIHGAYGKRWRSSLGFDQLEEIVRRLRADPTDRQCVLQMWDSREFIEEDGSNNTELGNDDLQGKWKDRPCNTHCYFRVRMEPDPDFELGKHPRIGTLTLDMTILCRSNDIVWGAYGANAVHMSMLMEYVAGRVGCGIGTMFQFSNNYHAYVDMLDKLGDPEDLDGGDPYDDGAVYSVAMGTDWVNWDDDLVQFMSWHDSSLGNMPDREVLNPLVPSRNQWFYHTAGNVALANWRWKNGFRTGARLAAENIGAPDWRAACVEWIDRRME
jgi:thymidylate synthase